MTPPHDSRLWDGRLPCASGIARPARVHPSSSWRASCTTLIKITVPRPVDVDLAQCAEVHRLDEVVVHVLVAPGLDELVLTRALERQGLLLRDENNPALDLEPADGFEQLLGAAVR